MKKYISLEDVYSNVGQKVTPIPRRSINEWTILAADEGVSPIPLGDVDEKFLRRLEKEINHHQGGVEDLLKTLIDAGHWNRGMKDQDYKDKILSPAKDALKGIPKNINPDALKQLIKNKKDLTGFGDAIINAANNNAPFNYLDSLEEVASQVFQGNTRALLDRLYATDFQQSNVNVGKGELVATLFSNAVKGKKGDLDIPGIGEVEIKGSQGRPGKSGGLLMGSRSALPKMLLDIGKDRGDKEGTSHNIFTGKEIQKFLLNLTKSVNELKGYVASLIENPKFTEITDTKGVPVTENIRYIYDNIDQLTNPETIKTITNTQFGGHIDRIHTAIENSGLPKTQINTILSKLYEGSKSKPGLITTFEKYHHSKDRKTVTPGNEEDYHWSDVVKQYFMGDWGLEKHDIVNGFIQLGNENLNDQETSQLREALTAIVDDDLMRELKDGNKAELDAVVATIHSVLYQHKSGGSESEETFPIMLLINSKTKTAFPLTYPGRDLKEKFRNHYETIRNLMGDEKLKIGLSVDPRSKGVQFTYTG